jgi:hypothetical protein
VLGFGLILIVFSGGVTAAVAEYSTVAGFLKKWGLSAVAVGALFAAGIVLGNVARSAMCASVWICD